MSMDKKKSPFGKTVKEYSESTTIHGIGYIFENGLYIFERILWISVVILGIVCAIYLSVTAYLEWKANPVLTTVATTGFPIEKVEFPSITICAQVRCHTIFFNYHTNFTNILFRECLGKLLIQLWSNNSKII